MPLSLGSFGGGVDFPLLVDRLWHIVWIVGDNGVTEYLNQRGTEYVGPDAVAEIISDWTSVIHPDDVEALRHRWRQAVRTLEAVSVECRLRRFDGQYRWHAVHADPLGDRLQPTVKWVGTATDIDDAKTFQTDLQAAERGAAETLALLETLQSNAPVGFGFVDRDYRRVRVNAVLAAFNGSTVEEQLGRRLPDLTPLVWPQMEPRYRRVLDTGESILDVEIVGPSAADPDKDRHWLVSYFPVALEADIIGVGVIATDVTQRRDAERDKYLMSAIVESSGDAIFGTTPQWVITTWNGAAERLFGYTAAEMTGRSAAIMAPATLDLAGVRARLMAGGPAEHLDTPLRRSDGAMVETTMTVSPVSDHTGAIAGLAVIAADITDRTAAQRRLDASERRLAEAQRTAEVGSFEFDAAAGELTWSAELYRILGVDPNAAISVDLFISMTHPDDRELVTRAWADGTGAGSTVDLTLRMTRADQRPIWVDGRFVVEVDQDGRPARMSGTLHDVTERVRVARAQKAAEIRFEAGFEQGGIGAGILDLNGIPTRVNAATCQLMGRPAESLIGHSCSDFNHPDDVPLAVAMAARTAAGYDTFADERRYLRPDGTVVWADLHITLVRDDDGQPAYYLAQLQDIDERKKMEADLTHQALHDSLTGLANRALLGDRLTHSLIATRKRGANLGVIFLDIDNIKTVNDTLGHRTGDELLKQVGARISGAIRAGDSLARFGGDEFVVICEDASSFETRQIAESVSAAIKQSARIGDHELHTTASIGIAFADAEATPESLLGDADAAMYVAKSLGRDRIEFFTDVLRSAAEERMATASAMRHALARNEFVVHYQPVIDLRSGQMVSAEALLRWEHPERGLISPAEFIPLAEESGLIIPIGAWVLEQACTQIVEWRRRVPSMSIAVNISVRQLLAVDITQTISDILSRTGVTPAAVCLELTESVFMPDTRYVGDTLATIRALGVALSIDDFGTGYSSLSYLKQFPVDSVKIDRAFVSELTTDPDDSALVVAILAMADALKLTVTAEGIETAQQLRVLRDLNCPRAQGFYLSRPVPAASISRLIVESHLWSVD